jgi:DNA-binding response OmpR family regulator
MHGGPADDDGRDPLKSLDVLVVEDDALIAMLVEDAVAAAGHRVACSAATIQDAMQAASTADFDLALLDVNLGGQKSHALPVILSRRGKPFIFVTGYGAGGVLDQYRSAPVVNKPFEYEDIAAAIRLAVSR